MIEAVVLKPVALEPDAIIETISMTISNTLSLSLTSMDTMSDNVSNKWSLQNMGLAELGFGVTVLQALLNFSGMAPLMLLPVGY